MSALQLAQRIIALAATPVFIFMAGVCALIPSHGGESVLSSMELMYGLMALFHAGPWLRSHRE